MDIIDRYTSSRIGLEVPPQRNVYLESAIKYSPFMEAMKNAHAEGASNDIPVAEYKYEEFIGHAKEVFAEPKEKIMWCTEELSQWIEDADKRRREVWNADAVFFQQLINSVKKQKKTTLDKAFLSQDELKREVDSDKASLEEW